MDDLLNFREQRTQVFNHGIKIFIFGVDVTRWVKGDLSVSYANRDSYNTASFDLSNPHKIWQITPDNLGGRFKTGASEFSESPKRAAFFRKQRLNKRAEHSIRVVKSSFSGKSGAEEVPSSELSTADFPFEPPAFEKEEKYRLALNDCIFNKNDPIRIFLKNPLSFPNEPKDDEWVEVFCGFVQECPISTNYITGESTVRISCSCIKQQMTKMRVQINVHLANTDPQKLFDDGLYQDFIRPSIYTHPFAISSLEDSIKGLIVGLDPSQSVAPGSQERTLTNGVGSFKLGNIICYNPAEPGNILERWHLMTLFGVNKVPFPSEQPFNDNLWLTTQEMLAIGKSTVPVPDPICPGPTGRYLHMLLPMSGTGAAQLVNYNTAKDVASAREWTNRWEVIREMASHLDFQVLTSPSGDILLEFPQYSFTPCAYQSNPLKKCDTPMAVASLLTFDLHQKEDTQNDEAEDFPTILTASGGMAKQDLNVTVDPTFQPKAVAFSPALVERYGVVAETVDFPFVGQTASEYGKDENSPMVRRLAQLALLEFTKRMANASTWSGSLVYRPFLFPNRPLELKRSARVGNITAVSHRWSVGKDATTEVTMNMLMALRENKDGTFQYRLLTGALNTPIDYKSIWGGSVPGSTAKAEAGAARVVERSGEVSDAAPQINPIIAEKASEILQIIRPGSRITSNFGSRRAAKTPNGQSSTNHKGLDISGQPGAPVYTPVGGGTVRFAGPSTGPRSPGLLFIEVVEADGSLTRYLHVDPVVSVGSKLQEGQLIAYVGPHDKYSSGPHLHLEHYPSTQGSPQDPNIWFAQLAEQRKQKTGEATGQSSTTNPPPATGIPSAPQSDEIQNSTSGVQSITGSTKQGAPGDRQPPNTGDAKTKGQPTPTPKTIDVTGLYPAFATRLQTLVAEAAKRNYQVTVLNTVGEPKNSEIASHRDSHRLGLAADLSIRSAAGSSNSGISTNPADYEILQTINQELELRLQWGGDSAPWHFELASSASGDARNVYDTSKENGKSSDEAVQEVWKSIDANNPDLVTKTEETPGKDTGSSKDPVNPDIAPNKPCVVRLLASPGLKGSS